MGFEASTRIATAYMVLCLAASAQLVSERPAPTQAADPQPKLLEENDFFRVTGIELKAGEQIDITNRNSDAIVVPVSHGIAAIGPEKNSRDISPGDAEFVQRGSNTTVSNAAASPVEFIAVTLKRHWDANIRRCTEPKRCTHSIQAGGVAIGQSTSLFGNGFITAYSHQLDRGGTLASSYFSSTGQDHLLLVALTDLQASFDGQDENLKAGQVYASDAGQIEVNAGQTQARWVVIRMEIPTHSE